MTESLASSTTNSWHGPTWRGFSILAVIAIGLSTLAALPAGASSNCGTYSFSFDGTRLLNDGISNSAGPFAADLPAGTYTVTLTAHDHHSTQPDVESQPAEQYRVVLDSGYVSPASHDIPDDADTTTSVFTGQVIGQTTSISVTHVGEPGINSVSPVCVGFTPEPQASDDEAEPVTDRDPAGPDVAPQDPIDNPVETPDFVLKPPIQDIGEPVAVIRGPAAEEPAPANADNSEGPEVQVAGITAVQDAPVAQVPLLAITGPTIGSLALAGLALLLLTFGGLLLRQERRLARQR